MADDEPQVHRHILEHARAVTAQNTYVPIAVAIAMSLTAAGGVVYYFKDRGSIDEAIRGQSVEINRRIDAVSLNVDKLASSIDSLAKTIATRSRNGVDPQKLCLQQMILNPGFRCPAYLTELNRSAEWTVEVRRP